MFININSLQTKAIYFKEQLLSTLTPQQKKFLWYNAGFELYYSNCPLLEMLLQYNRRGKGNMITHNKSSCYKKSDKSILCSLNNKIQNQKQVNRRENQKSLNNLRKNQRPILST